MRDLFVNPEHVEVVRFTRRQTSPGIGAGGYEDVVVFTMRDGKDVLSSDTADIALARAWCEKLAGG